VVLRHVFRGVVRSAFPMRVVFERSDRLALWMPAGAITAKLGDAQGRRTRELLDAHRRLFVPSPTEQLHLIERGRAHSVQARWVGPDRRFQGWYVNLQEPVRPSALGWDTHDQQLDVLIGADGVVQWKDEDQFAAMTDAGWYTPTEAALVRREGHAVLAAARSGLCPFDEGWDSWTPDPSWAAPELPAGWEELEAVVEVGAELDVA
jgi:hypothetical protein